MPTSPSGGQTSRAGATSAAAVETSARSASHATVATRGPTATRLLDGARDDIPADPSLEGRLDGTSQASSEERDVALWKVTHVDRDRGEGREQPAHVPPGVELHERLRLDPVRAALHGREQ